VVNELLSNTYKRMKYLRIKDKKKRTLSKKYELRRVLLKCALYNEKLPKKIQIYLMKKLHELPKKSSFVQVRNRCVYTGRGKGVYRSFGVSRMLLRSRIHDGLYPGILKASW
jgi:small subunit ribosomal protein S14